MAQDINKVTIIGRLTRDPEVKFLPSGTAIMEFSIASNDRIKRGENWEDKASFFDCTTFGRQAETLGEYLHKGSQVGIDGKLSQDTWQDKQTGQNRSKVKIIAERVQMLGGKGGGSGQSQEQRQEQSGEENQEPQFFQQGATAPSGNDDPVPF